MAGCFDMMTEEGHAFSTCPIPVRVERSQVGIEDAKDILSALKNLSSVLNGVSPSSSPSSPQKTPLTPEKLDESKNKSDQDRKDAGLAPLSSTVYPEPYLFDSQEDFDQFMKEYNEADALAKSLGRPSMASQGLTPRQVYSQLGQNSQSMNVRDIGLQFVNNTPTEAVLRERANRSVQNTNMIRAANNKRPITDQMYYDIPLTAKPEDVQAAIQKADEVYKNTGVSYPLSRFYTPTATSSNSSSGSSSGSRDYSGSGNSSIDSPTKGGSSPSSGNGSTDIKPLVEAVSKLAAHKYFDVGVDTMQKEQAYYDQHIAQTYPTNGKSLSPIELEALKNHSLVSREYSVNGSNLSSIELSSSVNSELLDTSNPLDIIASMSPSQLVGNAVSISAIGASKAKNLLDAKQGFDEAIFDFGELFDAFDELPSYEEIHSLFSMTHLSSQIKGE